MENNVEGMAKFHVSSKGQGHQRILPENSLIIFTFLKNRENFVEVYVAPAY